MPAAADALHLRGFCQKGLVPSYERIIFSTQRFYNIPVKVFERTAFNIIRGRRHR